MDELIPWVPYVKATVAPGVSAGEISPLRWEKLRENRTNKLTAVNRITCPPHLNLRIEVE